LIIRVPGYVICDKNRIGIVVGKMIVYQVTNEIVKSGPVVGRHIKIHIRYNIPICGK
jgi:hypothetical protein